MSTIKFNYLTKNIEVKGSESFIESNIEKIQELMIESFGEKRKMVSKRIKAEEEPISALKAIDTQKSAEMVRQEPSGESQPYQAIKPSMPEIAHALKAKRPPLRKYIRKVGDPGLERIVVEVVEQKPKEISLASLKEKFGLSDSKIGGTVGDAEKLGKMRRVMNGSSVWSQD